VNVSGQIVVLVPCQEKHAAVGQRDLPRPGPGTSADEAGIADRMVRATKRTVANEGCIGRQQACNAVDLRDFQRLIHQHARQNAGQRLGDQRLAGPWRPTHQNIM
jgi:hypothetical protein